MNLIATIKKNSLNLYLFAISFFLLYTMPLDPDLGWHLAYGNYLIETGTLLRENIFSYNFVDYDWANSYVFAQLIMSGIYKTLGLPYISLILSLFLAGFVVFIASRLSKSGVFRGVFVVSLSVVFGLYNVTVRPLYFSSIFLILLVYVLSVKPQYEKYLPILFLFWANFHADFVIAFFVYGIFLIFRLLDLVRDQRLSKHTFFSLVKIPFLSIAATFLNPFFYELHFTLLKETHPFQFAYIAEWRPLGTSDSDSLLFMLLFYFIILYRYRNEIELPELFALLFLGAFAFRARYFLRPAMILGAFVFPLYIYKDIDRLIEFINGKFITYVKAFLIFILLLSVPLFIYKFYMSIETERWSERGGYPYKAVNYLKQNDLKGSMINQYSWGGYLILYLPEYKTYIDGRMPSWRTQESSVFEDYAGIMTDPSNNSDDLYAANFLLIRNEDSDLVEFINSRPEDWKLEYSDNISLIYLNVSY